MKLILVLILLASTISQLAIAVDPDPAQPTSITTNEPSELTYENLSQAQLKQAFEQGLKYVADNYVLSQQNQSDIAGHKTAIGGNVTNIATNTSDIAAIKAAIGGHVTNIATNTSDIAAIKTAIGGNATSVANNTSDIAAIKTAIAGNATGASNNTSDIADHKLAVGKNTSDIAANKTAIDANTNHINSNFAALDKISYNNGTMTFGSAGSDPETSRTKMVQLFDPTSTSQSEGALNQEMLYNRSILSTLDQRTTATNQQIQNLQWQYNDLSRTVDKQGKAISVNAAFAALPSGYMPDKNFIGIGVGHFKNHTGVALGLTRNFDNGVIIQGRYGASGGISVVSAAAGISF